MGFHTNTENKDEWLTPPGVIQAIGPFDLDPCAPISRPWDMAAKHYTVEDYDISSGPKMDKNGWAVDQYGGLTPPPKGTKL